MTGYWVGKVTKDWRWRMTVPPKGDYQGLPLNAQARKLADAWDPAEDEAAGEQCRSYGTPSIMRAPRRIHITWEDEQTLRLETDAGRQVPHVLFRRAGKARRGLAGRLPGFLGYSSRAGCIAGAALVPSGALKVVTTKFRW